WRPRYFPPFLVEVSRQRLRFAKTSRMPPVIWVGQRAETPIVVRMGSRIIFRSSNKWHERQYRQRPTTKASRPALRSAGRYLVDDFEKAQSASGLGRVWICTAIGVMPLPPSLSHGVRSPSEPHRPRPFHPAFGSSMRASRPLV